MSNSKRICASLAISAIFCAAEAPAQQMADPDEDRVAGPGFWVAHGESDSISRSPTGSRGSYDALGVFVDAERNRDRFMVGLVTDLRYRQYSQDGLDDEQIGTLEAFADVIVKPERLTWSFREDYGQGQTDPFSAIGPENSESISVFSTGPTLELPIGRRTALEMMSEYSERDHEITEELDSDSLWTELGVYREAGNMSRFGIVAFRNDFDYDAGLTYEIDGAAVRYERTLATGDVLAELGRNSLAFGGTTFDGPRVELGWSRALGRRSRLGVVATRELTDSGALFADRVENGLLGSETAVVLTSSPLEQERVELFWELDSAKTDVEVGYGVAQDAFTLDPTLDNDSATLRIGVRRTLTALMSVSVATENIRRDFVGRTDEEGDRATEVSFDRRIGRRLFFQAEYSRYGRRGSNAFDENRYELRLRYQTAS